MKIEDKIKELTNAYNLIYEKCLELRINETRDIKDLLILEKEIKSILRKYKSSCKTMIECAAPYNHYLDIYKGIHRHLYILQNSIHIIKGTNEEYHERYGLPIPLELQDIDWERIYNELCKK